MANDFYPQAAISRANMIEAEMAAAKADLMAHRANNDVESASAAVQQIANLAAEKSNLTQLYNDYVASQQPPQKPYETPEQKAAKPWSQMGWDDIVDLTKTSRYAKDIRADDPNMIAGWHEARARRGRGE